MTVEERLEILERELGRVKRRNRWLLCAILLVAGGLAVPAVLETTAFRARAQAAGTAKEIHANAFILEDEKGNIRGRMLTDKDGTGLALHDEKGNICASLGVGKEGPGLRLYDEKGWTRAILTVVKDGPGLVLMGENGKGTGMLGVLKNEPRIVLQDENDMERAFLGITKNGPGLALHDENGRNRFFAGKVTLGTPDGKIIASQPEYSMIILGPDGKVIWSAIK